jgi:diacylglycerol kinase (ATP)
MQKVALLYNPDSGGRDVRRKAELESVVSLLRGAGIQAEMMLPHSPDEAQGLTLKALQNGFDTVFACGGDGTIHNIVQVLANTPAALAILPMGTANALAHDLGLPMNVIKAAKSLLRPVPRRVAIGRIHYRDLAGDAGSRFFVVAAGCGVDAHLFYKLHAGTKRRMGMAAYYAKAWHLWLSYPMARFQLAFDETGSGEKRHDDVTELMAVRIRNFGGVLQELAPGASLDRNDLRLVFCRTASRTAYLHYVARGLLRGSWKVRGIDLAYSGRVLCTYSGQVQAPAQENDRQVEKKVYVEADGELVGTLPAEISIVPDALTLLYPSR